MYIDVKLEEKKKKKKAGKADSKRPVAERASSRAYEAERADSKRPVAEMAGSRRPRCLNRGLCKYDYGYVSPASTDLREDLYKRQVW